MAASPEAKQLSDAVLSFALQGKFPEDIQTLPSVTGCDLQPSIDSLEDAKIKLESEIHTINEETKEDVSTWVRTAKALQEDIIRSKAMANEIVRQSEAPDTSGEAIETAETKVQFLNREVQYSQQLHEVLHRLQRATNLLNQVEQARDEHRILDSLRLLEESWNALDNIGVGKSCRAVRLLDVRAFELKSSVHDTFEQVWKSLVDVDVEKHIVTLNDTSLGGNMKLADAEIGLKSYKEMDERMEQLWRNIDAAVVAPRMASKEKSLAKIEVNANSLTLIGSSEHTTDALLTDLAMVMKFLAQKLPHDLLKVLNSYMMADVIPRLLRDWLDAEVPTSLTNMNDFQTLITNARSFRDTLVELEFSGFDELSEWVDKAPMIWLGKCRDTTLNTVRDKLNQGIGSAHQVEKIEKQMVSIAEGRELANTGAGAAAESGDWNEDWGGDAWNEDEATEGATAEVKVPEADDGADAWGWGDDEPATESQEADSSKLNHDDDGADAWGWDDEESATGPAAVSSEKPVSKSTAPKQTAKSKPAPQTRELILRETYSISSMPGRVLELLITVLNDGAKLTTGNEEYALVAGTAAGLFSMPTLALALFRGISPHYYSLTDGGNMFLYNDAMYLAEQLEEFATKWKERDDLPARAKTMLRLDNDIKTLQNFANRSYSAEMATQKTVLQDLLGSSQSIMQQDDLEGAIEAGTSRIETVAATWEPILARSVWSQAIGSLTDSLARRIIDDVLELPAIGQDEAYNIASAISSATKLDSLFLPSKLAGTEPVEDEVAVTAHYSPNWLRLQYLSEVLQSNLNDVRFLWCDRELSLYFTTEEMVDLVNASFEDNPKTRETIREIRAKQPLSAPL